MVYRLPPFAFATSIRAVVIAAVTCLASNAAAKPETEQVDLRAFGDSGYVGGTGVFEAPPGRWIERSLKRVETWRSPDINFLNLEGALTRSCARFIDKPFTFAIAPEALTAFGRWGFNLVSIANNHTLDCADPEPTREIDKALAEVLSSRPDLKTHGLASSLRRLLDKPALLTVRGVTIGMVALKAWKNGRRASIGNYDNRLQVMKALQATKADIRILSLHGGEESTRRPTDDVVTIAREFVTRYDGDIVFAHHPHKAQGFELIQTPRGRTAVIFYSLGNFLHNGLSVAGDGMMAKMAVGKSGVDPGSIGVYPLANASIAPGPVSNSRLKAFGGILRDSNAAIALRPLPKGLHRFGFTLEPATIPAPGFRVVPQ